MNNSPVRKSIRLAPENYLGFQQYFVTLCCFRRETLFSNDKWCRRVLELLHSESASRFFRVPAYCVMPDHLHFLAEGIAPQSNLLHFMRSFKIKTSREYAAQKARPLWQRAYYEHILRSGESMESVAWYIWLNPVRKGVASRPQQHKFAGSFTGMLMPAAWNAATWTPPWKKAKQ